MLDRSSPQSVSTLKRVIQNAFEGVRLDNGVGLREGQAIDDYEVFETRQIARAKDEKHRWERITADDLNHCSSSLSFFDAAGMRFHLPAYMMLVIDGLDQTDSLIFHLTELNEYMINNFSALDQTQRDAVYDFLRWCAHQPDHEQDRERIQQAMDKFWSIPS
jgi:hypothetical protein